MSDLLTPGDLVPVSEASTLPRVGSFPRYERGNLGCGIVHLGAGNFHRSHQALFVQEYLQERAEDWMIHGVSCLDSDIDFVRAMNGQDNVYTLTERSLARDSIKVIGSIRHLSHAPTAPDEVARALASPTTRIVSLTVSEKGYCYDSAGDLEVEHPMIRADLSGSPPVSVLGHLFGAAAQRRASGGPPFTVASCDNLPGNGDMTRRLVVQFAELRDPRVARWIGENIAFPNSMVDRITPAVTDRTLAFVRETFGIDDRCPVVSESYLKWVVEDRFINGRPALENVGVQFTEAVEPYEQLKVRLLNGSHSALSYAAYLMGFRHVDLAMANAGVRGFVRCYMVDDITPTIPPVGGIDIADYRTTLVERFGNPAIRDQVQRLAMDGSQKIRNAIVPPLEHQLASGGSIRWIAFALAAWYRYLQGMDENGEEIEIIDPMRDVLMARARSAPDEPSHLLSVREIFGAHVSANQRIAEAVRECLDDIRTLGTGAALSKMLASEPV
ncbi:MAG: mannitol dehydrogenase family protein [Candidatus Dormibacteria bacterium]